MRPCADLVSYAGADKHTVLAIGHFLRAHVTVPEHNWSYVMEPVKKQSGDSVLGRYILPLG